LEADGSDGMAEGKNLKKGNGTGGMALFGLDLSSGEGDTQRPS